MEEIKNAPITVGLLLIGIILIGLGVLGFKVLNFSTNQPEVQILGEESPDDSIKQELVVEISGEVQKPGVYKLASGSRINDLLIVSGGLSARADRGWVTKNVNLAQKLIDGVKIFIPAIGENNQLNDQTIGGKININTASEAELDTLWGIGPATAQKIISGRPYQKTEDLLTKKMVKTNVWETIKDKISVY